VTADFEGLSVEALRALADALQTGRLPTYEPAAVARCVPLAEATRAAESLAHGKALGLTAPQLAYTLRLLAREREARRAARDDIELVWTGPAAGVGQSRDTQVVVRELFASATRSVLIASYRIYQWAEVFGSLAAQMDARPDLTVRMYLHVDPPDAGESEAAVLARFGREFRERWPAKRLPEVFYDPRTLREEPTGRASLHAKCVVVDGRRVLVTSANFTQAAQLRNIEVGVVLDDVTLAEGLAAQFENLTVRGALVPVPTPARHR
jgi:phosphatidylserine/phosphatidylglycerophosphate/cardiolipin synthase-like enzyme